MGNIRVIHRRYYDSERKRFASPAFQPSSNGGISVFDKFCALETSGAVCQHIREYYAGQAGDPPIYWEIPNDLQPANCRVEIKESSTGDLCHRDIFDWSK